MTEPRRHSEWNDPKNIGPKIVDFSKLPPRKPTAAAIQAALEAVELADAAWAVDLDNADLKAAFKAAKAAFRALEQQAIADGLLVTCGRCNGDGVVHYGGVTFNTPQGSQRLCFQCGGAKKTLYRPHTFGPQPDTRAKNAARHEAKKQAEQAAFEIALATLPAAVADALRAAEAKYERLGGFYNPADPDDGLTSEESFRYQLAQKIRRFGSLTDKQVNAVKCGIVRDERRAAEAAQVAAAPALAEGKRDLVGVVVSTKLTTGRFPTLKMLVRLEDGSKVYGAVPRALSDITRGDWDDNGDYVEPAHKEIKGLRVTFTATVERSENDEHFGFFSRPTKVAVVS